MRYVPFADWLKANSLWVSLLTVLPLALISLALTACVDHPIGDPEASKVDERYSGVWLRQDEKEYALLVIRPYDARTYLVNTLAYTLEVDTTDPVKTEGKIKPEGHQLYKAWLTPIGDVPFLTLEGLNLDYVTGLSKETEYYVARLKLDEGVLSWQLVDGRSAPAKEAKSSRELEQVIRDHRDSKELYVPDTFEWRKCEDNGLLERIVSAFDDTE